MHADINGRADALRDPRHIRPVQVPVVLLHGAISVGHGPGCWPAPVAGRDRVPSPSRLHPVSIPLPCGMALIAAIALGRRVGVVVV